MAAVTIVGRIKNKHTKMDIGNEMLQQYLDKYAGINIDDKPQHDICNMQYVLDERVDDVNQGVLSSKGMISCKNPNNYTDGVKSQLNRIQELLAQADRNKFGAEIFDALTTESAGNVSDKSLFTSDQVNGNHFIIARLHYKDNDNSKNIENGRIILVKFVNDAPESFTVYNNVKIQTNKITLGEPDEYTKIDGIYKIKKKEAAATKIQTSFRRKQGMISADNERKRVADEKRVAAIEEDRKNQEAVIREAAKVEAEAKAKAKVEAEAEAARRNAKAKVEAEAEAARRNAKAKVEAEAARRNAEETANIRKILNNLGMIQTAIKLLENNTDKLNAGEMIKNINLQISNYNRNSLAKSNIIQIPNTNINKNYYTLRDNLQKVIIAIKNTHKIYGGNYYNKTRKLLRGPSMKFNPKTSVRLASYNRSNAISNMGRKTNKSKKVSKNRRQTRRKL